MRRKLKRKYIHFYKTNYRELTKKSYFSLLENLFFKYALSDENFIKKTYKENFGEDLNLDDLQTFNQKMQYQKLHCNQPIHTLCADKLAVREYIKEKVGEQYLIPLVMYTDNPKDIIPENLPDYPIVVKTNHDSGSYCIVKDKLAQDWEEVQSKMKSSLKNNYYFYWRERQYKGIKPTIIVEKLLQQKNGNVPYDYKFHCSRGKVLFIQVVIDRESINKINLYSPVDWQLLPFRLRHENGPALEAPKPIKEMVHIAERLSKDFNFARIDLYVSDDQVFFGEITFTPGAGFDKFIPESYDLEVGKQIVL